MENQPDDNKSLLISYKTLRRAVGILGITLPLTLYVGCKFLGHCNLIQNSISHYYYTIMGDVLVGTLCAFGIFLLTYKGYTRLDQRASNLAGFCAICVALFPTGENLDLQCSIFKLASSGVRTSIHYGAAALFFVILAYISFFLFTKSSGHKTQQKIIRNGIYRVCAITIVLSILLIFLYDNIPSLSERYSIYKPVFCLESIALFAFGFSWLIKGESLFQDQTSG